MRRVNVVFGVLSRAENPWAIDLWLLRAEAGSSHTGGNKGYKLRGYLERARREGLSHMITMAGAHSNHLRAFAALARREGLKATAIIRGDELANPDRHSAEIRFALDCGVRLVFATRQAYRALRETSTLVERAQLVADVDFSEAIFVPEGGMGPDGIAGVAEWAAAAAAFEQIYLPCATGTTCAGFLVATPATAHIFGVAVLRNFSAVHTAIAALVPSEQRRFTLIEDYARGKFGKTGDIDREISEFAQKNDLVADEIYVARALLALRDRAQHRLVQGRVLFVYTYNE